MFKIRYGENPDEGNKEIQEFLKGKVFSTIVITEVSFYPGQNSQV